jgi:type III secretion protein U
MAEKTEHPTSKKLRDARQKGQVAQSKEVPSTAVLVSLFAVIAIAWPWIVQTLSDLMVLPAKFYDQPFEGAMQSVLGAVFVVFAQISMLAVSVAFVAAAAAGYFQVGPLFSFESIKPNLEKLNPASGFKKIFCLKNLIEFLKSVGKISFLGILLYYVIKDAIPPLMLTAYSGESGVLSMLQQTMKTVAINTALCYIVIAVADVFYQRWQHNKDLMMSKEEIKQEFKESEGDPHIKQKRKQLHREMLEENTMGNVRKSSVLVTTPRTSPWPCSTTRTRPSCRWSWPRGPTSSRGG